MVWWYGFSQQATNQMKDSGIQFIYQLLMMTRRSVAPLLGSQGAKKYESA
jgi:hypothetical protein